MTKTIDKLLVKFEFDRKELESVRTRKFLYLGIGFSLLFLMIFLPLAILQIA
ncbi:MAG: hypothetical protein HKO02_12130 [Hyphomonadaceae bacterium]|nr:hypothetical protein [Hyphomonadaceae bacterium]